MIRAGRFSRSQSEGRKQLALGGVVSSEWRHCTHDGHVQRALQRMASQFTKLEVDMASILCGATHDQTWVLHDVDLKQP